MRIYKFVRADKLDKKRMMTDRICGHFVVIGKTLTDKTKRVEANYLY